MIRPIQIVHYDFDSKRFFVWVDSTAEYLSNNPNIAKYIRGLNHPEDFWVIDITAKEIYKLVDVDFKGNEVVKIDP